MRLKFFSYLSGKADSTQDGKHNLEVTIEKIARSIKSHSDTEITLIEIAVEIYRNAMD